MAIVLVSHTGIAGLPDGVTTSAINTTGANLLVVGITWYVPNGVPTISDSKSNTWVKLNTYTTGTGDSAVAIFYSIPTSVGSGHTFTVAKVGCYSPIYAAAFSGVSSSPVDKQNGNTSTNQYTVQTGSVTPSQDNELLITALEMQDVYTTIGINGSFTIADSSLYVVGVTYGGALAYKIQTSAGAENPTWTRDITTNTMTASIATFKAISSFIPQILIF